MGEWLNLNGDAIYGTKPWLFQNDTTNPDVWYTSKNKSVYAILLKWSDDFIKISAIANYTFDNVKLLGYDGKLKWNKKQDSVVIDSNIKLNNHLKWAWVFEFLNVEEN